MECVPYVKQRWGELSDEPFPSSGSTSAAIVKNADNTSDSIVSTPCIVCYSGGTYGHVGIVEKYSSSKKQYFYSDHNGKNAQAYDGKWMTEDEIKKYFNTRTFESFVY